MTNLEVRRVAVTDYTYPVLVVIGDGNTVFDDNYPMDSRFFFYFHDLAEYELAKGDAIRPEFGFRIVREIN